MNFNKNGLSLLKIKINKVFFSKKHKINPKNLLRFSNYLVNNYRHKTKT